MSYTTIGNSIVVKCSVNYNKSTCNDVGIPERTKLTIFGMNKQIGSVI